eukprot:542701-Pleurochrysis_carterae.AAC.1
MLTLIVLAPFPGSEESKSQRRHFALNKHAAALGSPSVTRPPNPFVSSCFERRPRLCKRRSTFSRRAPSRPNGAAATQAAPHDE